MAISQAVIKNSKDEKMLNLKRKTKKLMRLQLYNTKILTFFKILFLQTSIFFSKKLISIFRLSEAKVLISKPLSSKMRPKYIRKLIAAGETVSLQWSLLALVFG